MTSRNKFGFGPMGASEAPRRDREPGPMGKAVREAAESLQESTEAKIEQRRRNADDAKAWRMANSEGRVLEMLPLDKVRTNALPRDRLELEVVASSDEMEELKASIRARGQREPIEVWRDGDGFQLKKGWRRLTAVGQLLSETGEERYTTIVARIEEGGVDRLARYVDMVEENVIREDLTFAEMAQVAIAAAADEGVGELNPDALVGRLYGALHKTKRSYIRSFVYVLSVLGDDLRWPKAVGRDLGVDLARLIRKQETVNELREVLAAAENAEAQNGVLSAFLAAAKEDGVVKTPRSPKPKLEFHIGALKVTARQGECRILSGDNFTEIPRDRLERAIKAFEAELRRKATVRGA